MGDIAPSSPARAQGRQEIRQRAHKIEAHQIANEVLRYFKRCPSYARKQQAEWFSAARGYLKSEGVKPS